MPHSLLFAGGSVADLIERNKKSNEVMGEGELKQVLIQVAQVKKLNILRIILFKLICYRVHKDLINTNLNAWKKKRVLLFSFRNLALNVTQNQTELLCPTALLVRGNGSILRWCYKSYAIYSNYLDDGCLHCLHLKMSVACSLHNFMFNYTQGLKYIHSLGLAHLDIKPGRLLSWTSCSWPFLILSLVLECILSYFEWYNAPWCQD